MFKDRFLVANPVRALKPARNRNNQGQSVSKADLCTYHFRPEQCLVQKIALVRYLTPSFHDVTETSEDGSASSTSALDAVADWAGTLSLGEQQRLAWARLLLARPQLALLDEATSALDQETEAALYKASQATLPSLHQETKHFGSLSKTPEAQSLLARLHQAIKIF